MNYSSVALLVDGDNLSTNLAGQILRKSKSLGPLTICRAYCNHDNIATWNTAPSFRVIHSGAGKNSSDILMSIDAMEFAFRDGIQAFVLASSDGDFQHAAHRLRECGRHVHGMGEEKAPLAFRKACTSFEVLKFPAAKVSDAQLDDNDRFIRGVLAAKDPGAKGTLVSTVNPIVRRKRPNFSIKSTAEGTWPKYFQNRPELYQLSGEGKSKKVWIAPATDW